MKFRMITLTFLMFSVSTSVYSQNITTEDVRAYNQARASVQTDPEGALREFDRLCAKGVKQVCPIAASIRVEIDGNRALNQAIQIAERDPAQSAEILKQLCAKGIARSCELYNEVSNHLRAAIIYRNLSKMSPAEQRQNIDSALQEVENICRTGPRNTCVFRDNIYEAKILNEVNKTDPDISFLQQAVAFQDTRCKKFQSTFSCGLHQKVKDIVAGDVGGRTNRAPSPPSPSTGLIARPTVRIDHSVKLGGTCLVVENGDIAESTSQANVTIRNTCDYPIEMVIAGFMNENAHPTFPYPPPTALVYNPSHWPADIMGNYFPWPNLDFQFQIPNLPAVHRAFVEAGASWVHSAPLPTSSDSKSVTLYYKTAYCRMYEQDSAGQRVVQTLFYNSSFTSSIESEGRYACVGWTQADVERAKIRRRSFPTQ